MRTIKIFALVMLLLSYLLFFFTMDYEKLALEIAVFTNLIFLLIDFKNAAIKFKLLFKGVIYTTSVMVICVLLVIVALKFVSKRDIAFLEDDIQLYALAVLLIAFNFGLKAPDEERKGMI